jgi:hypothetical protein
MAFLASYFMDKELSDIDVVVRLSHQQQGIASAEQAGAAPPAKRARHNDNAAGDPLQLAVLPGHRIVLFNSEYFKAQQVGAFMQHIECSAYRMLLRRRQVLNSLRPGL